MFVLFHENVFFFFVFWYQRCIQPKQSTRLHSMRLNYNWAPINACFFVYLLNRWRRGMTATNWAIARQLLFDLLISSVSCHTCNNGGLDLICKGPEQVMLIGEPPGAAGRETLKNKHTNMYGGNLVWWKIDSRFVRYSVHLYICTYLYWQPWERLGIGFTVSFPSDCYFLVYFFLRTSRYRLEWIYLLIKYTGWENW